MFQCTPHRNDQRSNVGPVHGLPGQSLLEGSPGDVLHDDVGGTISLAIVVDGKDVGMAQCGDGLGLAAEALQELRFVRLAGVQDLDRHPALELWLVGTVYHGHSAAPDLVSDPVAADRAAGPVFHHH